MPARNRAPWRIPSPIAWPMFAPPIEPTRFVNWSETAFTAGARYATICWTTPLIAWPANLNASFIACTSSPWALVSASPSRSACSAACWIPSAPPANSGSSSAPARPNICTAAADRWASVGSSAMADEIAWNRSAADIPDRSASDKPRLANPAWAVLLPRWAFTKATSAFVAALAILSMPTPARSPARASPANSP